VYAATKRTKGRKRGHRVVLAEIEGKGSLTMDSTKNSRPPTRPRFMYIEKKGNFVARGRQIVDGAQT